MKNLLPASSRLTHRIWLGLIAMLVFSAIPAFSTTWTVTSRGDDPGDTTTLRGALAAAADGDIIDLTGLTGTITLTYGAVPILRELPVSRSLTITGPGAGKLAIDGNNFSRVFHVFGVNATISGLTIQNGNAGGDGDITTAQGGGVRNSGTLTLTDCAVSGNTANRSGGGVFNVAGKSLTISNCTISGNSANFEGGGIYNDSDGSVTVISTTISSNTAGTGASGADDGDGAGIYNKYTGTLTVSSSAISKNVAKGDPDPSIGGRGIGGGIANDGIATLTDTSVSDNQAQDGGFDGIGGAIYDGGTLTITNSTVSGNNDGAIFLEISDSSSCLCPAIVNVTNSTFYGNQGNQGYAISGYGTANLTSSTLAGNSLGLQSLLGTFTLKNTILANTGANCDANPQGFIVSQDHNISRDSSCAPFLIQPDDFGPATDPGLDGAGLKDNGGPTKTIALLSGSVAVDAITNSADCSVSTDQRGVGRPQGTNCDIGAYEATPDFFLSSISPINVNVDSSGTASVQVNSSVCFNSAVTLSTSGVPLDFAASFNPNPITPASYGSASSTLTVSLQPSVTSGTYSFTVTGTSGSLTHSVPVTVNVLATIAGTGTVISTDQALGCIDNSGISGALQSKLNAAQADIAAGRTQDAVNTLIALLNQLQAQSGKHISTACKDASGNTFDADAVLIADVKAILAGLGVSLAADPITGNAVNNSGAGIAGLTISLLSSSKSIVATATTDAMGFYYFPATGSLTSGATYTTKVSISKPYKNSTPSSQSFAWKASAVTLKNFVIN